MILLKLSVFESNHRFGIVIWRKLPCYGGQIAMIILIYATIEFEIGENSNTEKKLLDFEQSNLCNLHCSLALLVGTMKLPVEVFISK